MNDDTPEADDVQPQQRRTYKFGDTIEWGCLGCRADNVSTVRSTFNGRPVGIWCPNCGSAMVEGYRWAKGSQ